MNLETLLMTCLLITKIPYSEKVKYVLNNSNELLFKNLFRLKNDVTAYC